MKRKPTKRKTRTTPATLPSKPLRALGKKALQSVPDSPTIGGFFGPMRDRTEIGGVPLPPDLEPATRYYAGEEFRWLEHAIGIAPWETIGGEPDDQVDPADFPDWKTPVLNPDDWHRIRRSLEGCFRRGFYLALLRYADDLKSSAEAGPILERLRKNAKKGGAARRKKAAPTHKAICKRFRELRKTVPKKTALYLRIAGEFGMSEGQIRRIISDAEIE